MKDSKIDQVEYMIITHFDKNHVGGADILSNHIWSLSNRTRYQSNSNIKNSQKHLRQAANTNQADRGIFDADFPIYHLKKASHKGDNDYSLIVSIKYGTNSFLLAGDAEEIRLQELIEQGNLAPTFLKVPHHGQFKKQGILYLGKTEICSHYLFR